MLNTGSIVDGFSYNPQLKFLPNRYWCLALSAMEPLRRAKDHYRFKMYTSPVDSQIPIGPYASHESQIRIVPESFIWGMSVSVFDAAYATNVDYDDITCQITDTYSHIPFFSDDAYILGALRFNLSLSNFKLWPVLLPQPRCILGDGIVDIRFVNRTDENRYVQLCLFCAEPVDMIPEYRNA